jgi:hypothetical protein
MSPSIRGSIWTHGHELNNTKYVLWGVNTLFKKMLKSANGAQKAMLLQPNTVIS